MMSVRVMRAVAGFAGLVSLASVAGAVEIVAGPDLQQPAEDSMTVMWITDTGCTSWVEFGEDEALGRRAHHSRHGLIDAGQTVHRVTVEGLKPGTAYRYRVCSKEIVEFEPYRVTYGDTASSDTFAFTTLDDEKQAVSFVVLNDIHQRNELLTSLLKRAKSEPYDLVFLNGDILGHIDGPRQIIDHVLIPCTELFASSTPFVYVRGNHETRGRFARKLPDYLGLPDDRYYFSFDHGPVHFIVLDGGEDKFDTSKEYSGLVDFDRYRTVQLEWLEREIETEAFRRAPFRVVLVHMPPAPSERWHGPADLYERWRPVLDRGGIDLMISGHTHRYAVELPEEGVRGYPRVIGGAPKAGAATLIRIDATAKELNATITRDDGEVVGSHRIERRR
jgi:acid phosphatase type 7